MSRTITARINTMCQANVGLWRCFISPYGTTKDETSSIQALRDDFGRRLSAGIRDMLGAGETHNRMVVQSARRVFSEVEQEARQGQPDLSNLLHRIRTISVLPEEAKAVRRRCAQCVRGGGCKRFLGDQHPMVTQDAVIGPDSVHEGHKPLRDHLCATHFDEWIFKQWHEAWKNQTPLRSNDGKPMVFEPTPPPSLCERPVFDQDTLRFIEKRLDWVSEHEEGSAA